MTKEKLISTTILDDLTMRFLINSKELLTLDPKEYFFIIEEAHWFMMDFYKINTNLLSFSKQLLAHNGIFIDSIKDHNLFKTHRQTINVYGAMIFSKNFTHCLLVEQKGHSNAITFPKGKINSNETPIECAIRETKEEVGYDIKNKIIDISITVFDKITFYLVLNVDMNYKFKTKTRNEISRIFWFDLSKVNEVKNNKQYNIFNVAYSTIYKTIKKIKDESFKFDISRIERSIDQSKRKLSQFEQ